MFDQKKPIIVLFVCTGNSCRSVMAKGLLEKKIAECGHGPDNPEGKKVVLTRSAGVIAVPGLGASRSTIEVMKEIGVDVAFHLTQRLTDEMVKAANVILVMEKFHIDEVAGLVPSGRAKTFLLKDYASCDGQGGENMEVSDPIGSSLEQYRVCRDEIAQAIDAAAEKICSLAE